MINRPQREGQVVWLGVAAGKKIDEGMIVALKDDGLIVPATDADAKIVIGRSNDEAFNVDGADGEVSVNVQRKSAFLFTNSSGADEVKRAHLFKDCYLVDDGTVAAVEGDPARIVVGKVVEISHEGVWVEII